MSQYFAKIENNLVVTVIVADDEFIQNLDGLWIETHIRDYGGIDKETNLPSPKKNYAGIGYTYDSIKDVFIPPKPYDSWILDEDTCLWNAPVSYPEDGNEYEWNENTTSWVLLEQG